MTALGKLLFFQWIHHVSLLVDVCLSLPPSDNVSNSNLLNIINLMNHFVFSCLVSNVVILEQLRRDNLLRV